MKIQVEYTLTGTMEIEVPDTGAPWCTAKDYISAKTFKDLVKGLDKNKIPRVEEVDIVLE